MMCRKRRLPDVRANRSGSRKRSLLSLRKDSKTTKGAGSPLEKTGPWQHSVIGQLTWYGLARQIVNGPSLSIVTRPPQISLPMLVGSNVPSAALSADMRADPDEASFSAAPALWCSSRSFHRKACVEGGGLERLDRILDGGD